MLFLIINSIQEIHRKTVVVQLVFSRILSQRQSIFDHAQEDLEYRTQLGINGCHIAYFLDFGWRMELHGYVWFAKW